MPTYLVYAPADALADEQRADLAQAITDLHAHHTGAPKSFVQIIYLDTHPTVRYIGGQLADPRTIWVYGNIRSGRSADTRTDIAASVRDAIERTAQIPREHIWVYLNELTHTDMIEFGATLPQPGGEAAWIQDLPVSVRERLESLE